MDFLPPDLHHRMVFLRAGAPTPVPVVAELLTRLFEVMKGWGMPYQVLAAYDAAFSVLAIDREETLVELLEASAVDWLGERPPRAPTHRFGAFNRREDPEFADVYVCFQAEPDPAPPGETREVAVPFYVEVRFGVGGDTTPESLPGRFADALGVLRPDHAFVETAFQRPRALSETTRPHVGWATFAPERLGPSPELEAPAEARPVEGGSMILATPGAFDDAPGRVADRERLASVLLPFLEGRGVEVAPPSEPRPAAPRLAKPLYMQVSPSGAPAADASPWQGPPGPPQPPASTPQPPAPSPWQAPPAPPRPPSQRPPPSAHPRAEPASPPPAVAPAPAPVPRVDAGTVPSFAIGAVRAAGIVWSIGGASFMTGIAKVSFVLQSGWTALVAPDPLTERDQYHRRSTAHSLEDHTDIVPFLPRGEALVRGAALVAKGQRVRARFLVQRAGDSAGLVDKIIEIRGDLGADAGPYVSIPLRYELAVHDPATNPVGRQPDAADPPRILHPKSPALSVGLGSISPYWSVRSSRLRPEDKAGLKKAPLELPADFTWDALSAAPADQRIQGYFHGTERVYLEGYHAKDRVIDAVLPGVTVAGQAYFRDGSTRAVPLVADTLRVDLDRRVVSLTFRGSVPAPSLSPFDAVFGAAVVAQGGAAPAWPSQVTFPEPGPPPALADEATVLGGQTVMTSGEGGPPRALPFVDRAPPGEDPSSRKK